MPERKIIAIMWARGNGSSLHRKSVYPILGRPLISYILEAAAKSQVVDRFYVFTEDKEIAQITRNTGWQVIPRPERMVEYDHPQFDQKEIQAHQGRHILMDLGASNREIEEGRLSHRVKGIFNFNCNHCLIRPETIRDMYVALMNNESATRICLGVRVDPHLFIINSETGSPFPLWHQEGWDRRDYPPLYRLYPDTNIVLIDRLAKFKKERQVIYEIGRDEALDVHTIEDIALAEFYLQRRQEEEENLIKRKVVALCN